MGLGALLHLFGTALGGVHLTKPADFLRAFCWALNGCQRLRVSPQTTASRPATTQPRPR